MSITLDGTNGITTPDVESSGPISGTNGTFTGNLFVGATTPFGKATVLGDAAGTGTSSLAIGTASNAQGLRADLALYSTFMGTADNGARRTADIVAGYNGSAWGTEYLSFNVGNNGGANDLQVLTSEKFRIASAGQIGLSGANYGTSGQVLTSGGSGASPSWTSSALGSTVVSSKIGSRATATTYQNTTSGWLLVSVSMSNNGQTFLLGSTSGLGITGISMNVAASNMTYLVPPSWYYRVTGTVISVWTEGQA